MWAQWGAGRPLSSQWQAVQASKGGEESFSAGKSQPGPQVLSSRRAASDLQGVLGKLGLESQSCVGILILPPVNVPVLGCRPTLLGNPLLGDRSRLCCLCSLPLPRLPCCDPTSTMEEFSHCPPALGDFDSGISSLAPFGWAQRGTGLPPGPRLPEKRRSP